MEEAVLAIFEDWGFKAEKIPESNKEKRPDFLVADSEGVSYLVELKEKLDNPEKIRNIARTIDAGEIHLSVTPAKPKNTISGIIRDAHSQLESSNSFTGDYKVVWLAASGRDHEEKYEQFFATLYGSTRIWNIDSKEPTRICYFFRDSSFFRFRATLDAAILSHNGAAQLCLNPFSKSYDSLKSTCLFKFFRSKNAYIDPLEEERKREAYVADTDLHRDNEQSIVDYLSKKYEAQLMNIDVGYHSFTTAYPEEET